MMEGGKICRWTKMEGWLEGGMGWDHKFNRKRKDPRSITEREEIKFK